MSATNLAHVQTVACGWCGQQLGTKPATTPGETTGICELCLALHFPDPDKQKKPDAEPRAWSQT